MQKTFLVILCLLWVICAEAGSRQLGTGAVMQIEGASGSGIVPLGNHRRLR